MYVHLLKHRFFSLFIILSSALLCANTVSAQDIQVEGTVSGQDGKAIPGVTIVEKNNTGIHTVTDNEGHFRISLSSKNSILLFSFIGYVTQEARINASSQKVNIKLAEDVSKLNEVVVTGLATSIKRTNLANAVTTISAKEISGNSVPQTVDNALYGKLPGANIRANGGAPGGGISIQLRGISSLQGASQPLFIIDGVYLNNTTLRNGKSDAIGITSDVQDDQSNRLADINPDDIASIEVLKGASASAIYGTRANAGVIIITTKKGKAGKTHVGVSQDIGFSKVQRYLGHADWNEDKIKSFFILPSRAEAELNRYNQAVNTNTFYDLEKILYGGTPLLTNTSVNVSGGTDKTNFYLSGDLSDEKGLVKNTGFKRRSIRANINHRLNKIIDFSLNSNYINTISERGVTGNGTASMGYTLAYTPNYFNPYPDAEGKYPVSPYLADNPLALRDKGRNNAEVNRFIEAATMNVNLFTSERSSLKLSLQGGIDYLTSQTFVYMPEDLQSQKTQAYPGDLLLGKSNSSNTNLQSLLVFNHETTSGVHFTTQAGTVYLQTKQDNIINRGRGLVVGQTNILQAAVQQVLLQNVQQVKDFGVVAQQEVNFKDKVITTVGIRIDKSTLNGNTDQYYAFPKASLAVNLTKFSFWKWDAVSLFKLRSAYGQTGGLAQFGDTYSALNPVVSDGGVGSVIATRLGNPALKPERAGELELGTDIGLFGNRISLEATYYDKKVTDLIQDLNLATSTGVSVKKVNAASLVNKGLELGLTVVPVSSRNLTWTSRLLYWKNTTKLTKLDVPSYLAGAFGTPYGTYLYQQGVSPTTIVGLPQITPGVYTVWGNSQPDFQTSWYNDINFMRDFSFSFLLHWKKGGSNINTTLFNTDNGGTTRDWNSTDNPTGIYNGKYRASLGSAGVYVQDASYLRLREVNLNYTVPKTLVTGLFKNGVESIRLAVSATNLFTITPYKGYDPEVSNFGTQAINTGTDLFPYPSVKRLFFRVKVDF
jgi:TonB-linked SusC/RagA family outer membrane protein